MIIERKPKPRPDKYWRPKLVILRRVRFESGGKAWLFFERVLTRKSQRGRGWLFERMPTDQPGRTMPIAQPELRWAHRLRALASWSCMAVGGMIVLLALVGLYVVLAWITR